MDKFIEIVEEINKNLECANQNWLFGAGISYNANIPLMNVLTERVTNLITKENLKSLYEGIMEELPDGSHIEYILSHLGDYIAIAERSKHRMVRINGLEYGANKLRGLHTSIIKSISETVRYGYCKADEVSKGKELIGKINKPIIRIESHMKFAETLLEAHANILTRSAISIFTTNYDTLIEDAFSLCNVEVNDGFIGASIGTWKPDKSYKKLTGINVVKLHGSVDWVSDSQRGLLRIRYGVNYNLSSSDVLIYPQATKYVETQKDPFASLFTEFRNRMSVAGDNVLIVCGYSFGDSHINSEIYQALSQKNNKTTLIAFVDYNNDFLLDLLKSESIAKKVYVASKVGIYHGSSLLIEPEEKKELTWWKFENLTNFIKSGDVL